MDDTFMAWHGYTEQPYAALTRGAPIPLANASELLLISRSNSHRLNLADDSPDNTAIRQFTQFTQGLSMADESSDHTACNSCAMHNLLIRTLLYAQFR